MSNAVITLNQEWIGINAAIARADSRVRVAIGLVNHVGGKRLYIIL